MKQQQWTTRKPRAYKTTKADDDNCDCATCLAIAAFAKEVASLDAVEGYRSGLARQHTKHGVHRETYRRGMSAGDPDDLFGIAYEIGDTQVFFHEVPDHYQRSSAYGKRAVRAYKARVALLRDEDEEDV